MKTRIIKCSVRGVEIERSIKTKVSSAKCETCRGLAISETKRRQRDEIGQGGWSTRSEIRFINNLDPKTARKLLKGPNGLQDRTDWGTLNKEECIAACRERAGI